MVKRNKRSAGQREGGVTAVEYFIRTGKLYPGIAWARQT